jgi:calcineurin-like phosphoesterase family protein
MRYFLTTDTHFNHDLIKEYCGRPDDFEAKIVNGFKSLTKDHILIHLGDICIGHETEAHEKYIIPLPCKKILVRGNHDKKSSTWYMEHGWDWVCNTMTLERGGKKLLFSHFPMVWDGYWEINFHGHFHNANHRRWEAELNGDLLKGQRLLALEYNDYKLWDLDKELERNNNPHAD